MRYYLQQGQAGLYLPRPVSAFHRYNSSNITVANNTTVVPNTDTIMAEDGPFLRDGSNYIYLNDGGWTVAFLTATFSAWSGSSHYRSVSMTYAGEAAATLTGKFEGFQEGTDENSFCAASAGKQAAGGRYVAQVYQVSGTSKTMLANEVRHSAIRISDLTARGGRAFRTTAQAFTANVEAAISFSSADTDEEGFWAGGSPTRMTIPTGMAGWYFITATAGTPTSTPTAIGRRLALRLNGTTYLAYNLTNGDGGNKENHVTALYYLADGDYVEAMFMSTSNVSLNQVNGPYGSIALLRVAKNNYPAACISRANAQTIGINTNEVVQFDNLVKDDWGMSAIGGANPERLTVPANQGGWYIAVGNHRWAANTDNFNRMCSLHVDGGTTPVARTSGMSNYAVQNEPCGSVGAVLKLVPGNYVTMQVWNKNTGATRNINANEEFLSLVRVDV